jgi:DNA (cytosine-5)-methyltransferase 1
MFKELIIDSFAGGGGASLGIAWALGRGPDIAINHDADAIAMHEANHPSTAHVLEDVWRADLRKLVGRRKVGLLWASPDCKHFSRAKGGKPVEKSIRSLAWIVCKWADQVRPRIIALENVREFADWGPLVPRWVCSECGWNGTEGKAVLMRVRRKCPCCDSKKLKITNDLIPCPARKGVTFKRFIGRLRSFGYRVEWRNLDAADFGSPTHRKRLFLIARCDGQPIEWPEPTHASPSKIDSMPLFGRFKPYRMAAECIDWSIPCPSIFDRKKPLAEKTLRRIALGIKRYVIDSAEPFIIQTSHTGTTGRGSYVWPTDEPTRTISQSSEFAVVSPILSRYNGSKTDIDDRCQEMDIPISTLDTQPRFALISPTLVSITHNGERKPIDPNGPLPTITTAHRGEIGLAAATLIRQFGTSGAVDITDPAPTATSIEKTGIVTAFLAKHFGGMVGVEVETPLPTTTVRGTQNQIVAANLVHLNHGAKQWSGVDEPTRTITSAGNHAALVYSFLVKYFGTAIGSSLTNPMPTSTGKDRFGLVTVVVNGEPYVIVDIGMRMLTPRELARAQGFPDTYLLTGNKTSQVARIGNSVCPQVASAVVKVNCFAELSVS